MEDKRIVELYLSRNESAIAETSSKYGSYCFSIANKILNNKEDSDECVNDTWLKVWNLIPPTVPAHLRLFLAKITRNLSFDKYRTKNAEKRGKGEISLVMDELQEVIAGSSNVEEGLEMKELVRTINEYLQSLPERECNIFVRRYFYVDSVKDIAKSYGIKQGNVSMILSRTRKRLKEHLEQEEYFI